MKLLIFIFTFVIFFSCSDNNFSNDFLSFEIRLAESEHNPNLKEMIFYNSDQKFFVYDSVYLNNDDITTTEIIDWQTQPKVQVMLNDAGREKFAAFTEKNVGKNAAMIVDNKLVSAPRINAQIRIGKLIITGLFSHEEALKIAEGILPKD
jgi:preprotein translocase subunit SecD